VGVYKRKTATLDYSGSDSPRIEGVAGGEPSTSPDPTEPAGPTTPAQPATRTGGPEPTDQAPGGSQAHDRYDPSGEAGRGLAEARGEMDGPTANQPADQDDTLGTDSGRDLKKIAAGGGAAALLAYLLSRK
jgi:hypothetical protein